MSELAKNLNPEANGEITLADLKNILTSKGERMTNEEFDGMINVFFRSHNLFNLFDSLECLKILCGENAD